MVKDINKLVEEKSQELLSLMGISSKVKIENDEEGNIKLDILSPDAAGLLIGHHGQTISSIQNILGLIVRQETGEWKRIIVNVGDYREKQEEHLVHLAKEAADRVKQTGEPQPIYNLTPAQRRIVHLELSKDENITSESTGEGDERFIVVSPKNIAK